MKRIYEFIKKDESIKIAFLVIVGIVSIIGVVGYFTNHGEITVNQYQQVENAGKEFPELRPCIENAMKPDGKIDQSEFHIIMNEHRVLKRRSLGETIFGNWKQD